jgi:hypothetical protein
LKPAAFALLSCFAVAPLWGCTVGEGEGWVRSSRLYIRECWNGGFELGPDFFASAPFSEETQVIRVQRGDNLQEVSDGLMILVNDTEAVRAQLGQPLAVGKPKGIQCPGWPLEYQAEPPLVNMSLYLHDSCHTQEGATVHSIDGTITFNDLFSGDINEQDGSERLTDASFTVSFANPCDLPPGEEPNPDLISTVTGYFKFFFQRGQPAQPFP